jgi:hypothetical protein
LAGSPEEKEIVYRLGAIMGNWFETKLTIIGKSVIFLSIKHISSCALWN